MNVAVAISLLSILILISLPSHGVSEQHVTAPESVDTRYAQLAKGQLFTVRLRPLAKSLDVEVIGNKAAKLEMSKIGLQAELYIGDRIFVLTPKRNGHFYSMETPLVSDEPTSLHLRINNGDQHETYQFKLKSN